MNIQSEDPLEVVYAVLRASEKKDAAAYLENYLDDAVMRRADGVVLRGKAEISRNFHEYVASERTRHVEILDTLSFVQGDTALVCTSYRMTFTGGSQSEPLFGSSHDVLERQADGSWLLSIDHPFNPFAIEP